MRYCLFAPTAKQSSKNCGLGNSRAIWVNAVSIFVPSANRAWVFLTEKALQWDYEVKVDSIKE